jgi:NADPH-dependent 2,4-dienoyl-CoA reductase/sulfur reductase-like enzyme/nitrite reductase/ring-hydroxylating ferredoxin subunit
MSAREHVALRLSDLVDGGMAQVEVAGTEVLLVRAGKAVRAFGARCPHYGAPLADGLLSDGRILCPWHHAAFDAMSGDLLEPPSGDCLARFSARIEDGRVLVSLSDDPPAAREPDLAGPDPARDPRLFAIVGAGAAGTSAAQSLRERGFRGRIVLITAEEGPPYDRTLLSKEVMRGVPPPTPVELRPAEFFARHGIELWCGRRVRRLDARARTIAFEDGATLDYDQALLATGGTPRRLDVPGADLANVFTLRSRDDAERILAAVDAGRRAIVVGGSFIALECAASLQSRGIEVTVIAPEELPFAKILGQRVARALTGAHSCAGTSFRLGEKVSRFIGNGRLQAALTDAGARLSADLAIVGIGIRPATDFLAGVPLEADGGVRVDAQLRVTDGLFAAGDLARFTEPVSGEAVRIEHWRLACQHGRVAAGGMLGHAAPYAGVPFFWSAQHLALYHAGHAPSFDQIIHDGAPEEGPFIAYYAREGRVLAALGVQRNLEMDAIEELLREKRMPPASVIEARGFDVLSFLKEGGN